MTALRLLSAKLRALLTGNRAAGRLEEELREHAEMLASDYERRGMSPSEARSAARRELGNVRLVHEQYREQNGLPLIENFLLDLKYAFRTLRRSPAFTASCIATLAFGLAAMITVLCVADAFLWKPLPYADPGRLVELHEADPTKGAWPFSEPDLLDLGQRAQSFSGIAAYRRRTAALTGVGEPETLQAAAVTSSFFPVLGIAPFTGAAFRDPLHSVVITRRLFARVWKSDPLTIGRTILLDGQSYSIAGVADPPRELLPGVELFLPLVPSAAESRTAHDMEAVARLRDGIVPGQAQAELNTIAAGIARQHAGSNAGWGLRLTPLAEYLVGPGTSRTVWMILAAVGLLWILACANVAGLQLARSVTRAHELGTRLALGAGRGRLLAQTLTESLVLALCGALCGAALARLAIEGIRDVAANSFPQLASLEMDPKPIAIAVLCMFLSTVVFGAFSGRATEVNRQRGAAKRDSGRDVLIVVQVALAGILLVGAGLLSMSFIRLRAVNPGFDPEKILTVRIGLPARITDNVRRVAFFGQLSGNLSRIPGIEAVGATNVIPFSGESTGNRFRTAREAGSPEYHSAAWRAITPGFFATLHLPLLRGRLFTDADANGAPEVIILTESMSKRFWPGEDPIGKPLLWGSSGHPKTIVGIVGDMRDLALDAPAIPTMFRPFAQLSDAPMALVIRTGQDPLLLISDIRRVIRSAEPNAALNFQPLRDAMADSILRPRAGLLAVSAFALTALFTAAFGLYGLIQYRVNQRQSEIGIRLALGASASSVRWTVQKRCLLLVCLGAAVGLPLASVLSRFMASLLYQTQPTEISAYAAVLIVFIAVAFCASFGPARRASRMDPAAAIRHE